MKKLKSPYPYFGGKARIADAVWARLGDPVNYIEPFCGSLAVALGRKTPARIETFNDLDCYLANFWRAIKADPVAVARFANWAVNEADLHARHRWLVGLDVRTFGPRSDGENRPGTPGFDGRFPVGIERTGPVSPVDTCHPGMETRRLFQALRAIRVGRNRSSQRINGRRWHYVPQTGNQRSVRDIAWPVRLRLQAARIRAQD